MKMKSKQNLRLFILILAYGISSCNNENKNTSKNKTQTRTPTTTSAQLPLVRKNITDSSANKKDDISSGIDFVFSNDTLCQSLYIKELSVNKEFKIPETIEFKLRLHDKLNKYEDKIFTGTAKLTSSDESFVDSSENDPAAYSAGDYELDKSNYKIQIRLDIQDYEACVISVAADQPDSILGGFRTYLKNFPDNGVMKKGECK
jgi:hypothetical protein